MVLTRAQGVRQTEVDNSIRYTAVKPHPHSACKYLQHSCKYCCYLLNSPLFLWSVFPPCKQTLTLQLSLSLLWQPSTELEMSCGCFPLELWLLSFGAVAAFLSSSAHAVPHPRSRCHLTCRISLSPSLRGGIGYQESPTSPEHCSIQKQTCCA